MISLLPVLVVLLPGGGGLGLFFLRGRWWRRGMAAAVILAQGYLALTLPLEATWEILGFSLEWTPLGRLFVPLFGLLTLATVVQGEDPPYGPNFASLGLFVLASLSGLLISEPLVAASLLVTAGLVGLFVIPQRPKLALSWQAAYRYLMQTFVGGVALILGLLLLAVQGTALVGLPLLRIGVGLFALGFALRLGIVPLHRWLAEVEEHALSMGAALIVALINVGALVLLVTVFLEMPPAVLDPRANQLFAWGGLLSIGLGGLLGLSQDNPRRLVTFSTSFDLGFILYGLSAVAELSWLGALWAIFHHGLIQLLLHTSLSLAEGRWEGQGRLSWAGILGFWGGGFALVGLPPLSPSLGRWMILTVALRSHRALGAVMLGAAGAILLAYLRVGHRLFLSPSSSLALPGEGLAQSAYGEEIGLGARKNSGEPLAARLTIGLILVAMVALNFYPSALLTLMQQAIRGFAFPTS